MNFNFARVIVVASEVGVQEVRPGHIQALARQLTSQAGRSVLF